ncbi:type II secretion system protein N [Sphingosinicella soli]|uniref:Type II secretion system protein N n=1 Tax=Sphingosinicella soli TaxID=333708 RepID=A0A7W7B0Q8_9SPHN|nr:type II secretion system protein N [Sphingosinicella soli]MBB4631918.1 general secretion pathway protein N [Sphingosinicella soli]
MTAVSTRRLVLVFAVALVLCLLLMFPLALALSLSSLPAQGFHARAVSGSIWAGRAEGAGFGNAPLGDLRVSLSPLALFTGKARFRFAPVEGTGGPTGAVVAATGAFAAERITAAIPMPPLVPGLGATLALQDFSVAFADKTCRAASGGVTADVRMESSGMSLAGTATCANGRLLLPLTGRTPAGDASLFVHIAGDAAYTYEIKVAAGTPATDAGLAAAGFVQESGTLVLRGEGRLQ